MGAFQPTSFTFAAESVICVHCSGEGYACVLLERDAEAFQVSRQAPEVSERHRLSERKRCHDKVNKEHCLKVLFAWVGAELLYPARDFNDVVLQCF